MVNYNRVDEKITADTFMGHERNSSVTVYDLTSNGCRMFQRLLKENKRAKNPKKLGQIVNELFLEEGALFVKEVTQFAIPQEKIAEIRQGIIRVLNIKKDMRYSAEGLEGQLKQEKEFKEEHSAWISNTLRRYGFKPQRRING